MTSSEVLGHWGRVTATLDWCEENYKFSTYIAELVNTLSNFITVSIAIYGARNVISQKLPLSFLLGFLALGAVGVGSFAFHATLLYSAQLADELPMIFVASWNLYVIVDTAPLPGMLNPTRSFWLGFFACAFTTLFSAVYSIYRNPVFHQVVFAVIMLAMIFRTEYLMNSTHHSSKLSPETLRSIKRTFRTGYAVFVFGFLIWNLDNIFCIEITRWKYQLGWPTAFLLEGHAWWHVFTAYGGYLLMIGSNFLSLCINETSQRYKLTSEGNGVPYIKRLAANKPLSRRRRPRQPQKQVLRIELYAELV